MLVYVQMVFIVNEVLNMSFRPALRRDRHQGEIGIREILHEDLHRIGAAVPRLIFTTEHPRFTKLIEGKYCY